MYWFETMLDRYHAWRSGLPERLRNSRSAGGVSNVQAWLGITLLTLLLLAQPLLYWLDRWLGVLS